MFIFLKWLSCIGYDNRRAYSCSNIQYHIKKLLLQMQENLKCRSLLMKMAFALRSNNFLKVLIFTTQRAATVVAPKFGKFSSVSMSFDQQRNPISTTGPENPFNLLQKRLLEITRSHFLERELLSWASKTLPLRDLVIAMTSLIYTKNPYIMTKILRNIRLKSHNSFRAILFLLNKSHTQRIGMTREALISGERRQENLGKKGNNRDIYCFANRGLMIFERAYQLLPPSAKILVIPQFFSAYQTKF